MCSSPHVVLPWPPARAVATGEGHHRRAATPQRKRSLLLLQEGLRRAVPLNDHAGHPEVVALEGQLALGAVEALLRDAGQTGLYGGTVCLALVLQRSGQPPHRVVALSGVVERVVAVVLRLVGLDELLGGVARHQVGE